MRSLLIVCLIAIGPYCFSQNTDSLSWTLVDTPTRVNLLPYLYFSDKFHPSDSIIENGKFNKYAGNQPYRLQEKNWLFFIVRNATSETQHLMLESPNTYISRLELYVKNKNDLRLLGRSGEHVPVKDRAYENRTAVFPIELAPGSSGTYFLYVASPLRFQMPLIMWSPSAFARYNYIQNIFYGIYYGLLLFALIFSFFLALIFRNESIYRYYFFYIVFLLLFFLHVNGFGHEFFWTDWVAFDKRIALFSGSAAMFCLTLFTNHFLKLPTERPYLVRMFRFFKYAFILNVILALFDFRGSDFHQIYFGFLNTVNALFFITTIYYAWTRFINGFKPALLFSIAFLFFFSGAIINGLRLLDFMDESWFTLHAVQIGNVLEIIFLTLGLAYWFKNNYDERQLLLFRVNEQQKEMTEEKDRIALDLHDNIGTQLTALSLGLSGLAKNPSIESHKIQSLFEHANATILELRDTIWVISKDEIRIEELGDKIDTLLWRLRQQEVGVAFSLDVSKVSTNHVLIPSQAINLFRIVQEAVMNSLKHSQAKSISVILSSGESEVILIVQDNGIGFSLNENKSDHYGLNNMQKRADRLGSSLRIISQPGNGTLVEAKIKIQ